MNEKKPRGRPPISDRNTIKAVAFSTRIAGDTFQALQCAAADHGWSVSNEIQIRLERSMGCARAINEKQKAELEARFGGEIQRRAIAAIEYFIPAKYRDSFETFLRGSGAGNDPEFIQRLASMSFNVTVIREVR